MFGFFCFFLLNHRASIHRAKTSANSFFDRCTLSPEIGAVPPVNKWKVLAWCVSLQYDTGIAFKLTMTNRLVRLSARNGWDTRTNPKLCLSNELIFSLLLYLFCAFCFYFCKVNHSRYRKHICHIVIQEVRLDVSFEQQLCRILFFEYSKLDMASFHNQYIKLSFASCKRASFHFPAHVFFFCAQSSFECHYK